MQLNLFLSLCSYVGIPMAPKKTYGPVTTLSFVGIELDSVLLEARLPSNKLNRFRSLISEFLHRKKVTLKEVLSFTGLSNFVCSVVRPGRALLEQLIDLTLGIRSPEHKIWLNKEVKEDLKLWLSFFCHFNGRSFFLEEHWLSSTNLNLFTDASGALGFGVIVGSHWCYGKWPPRWEHKNIAILEFCLIVLSLHLWGEAMCNQCILFCTYNESLVHVINKQSCKDKSVFARKLLPICLQYCFQS